MLILVTGENLLIILLGWEGKYYCLKSFFIPLIYKRIGPHNIDVMST